jgi:hypothetical protein
VEGGVWAVADRDVVRSLHNDRPLLRLFTEPQYRDWLRSNARQPAVRALHDWRVLDEELVKAFPRWEKTKWLDPVSHLVREDLREPVRDWIPDDDDYARAFDAYEYRAALAIHATQEVAGDYEAGDGEFIGDWRWTDGKPNTEHDLRATLSRTGDDWPWWPLFGGREGYAQVLDSLREVLAHFRRG